MVIRPILSSASALALLTTTALADVTASEVWEDMQEMLDLYGATIETAGVEDGANRVAVSRMVVNFDFGNDDGTMSMDMGDVVFTETGDGRVRVDLADRIPVDMEFTSEDGDGSVSMAITQTGLDLFVSEDGEVMRYDSAADTIRIGEIMIDDPSAEEEFDFEMDVTMNDASGFTTIAGETLKTIVSESRAATITANITGAGIDENGDEGAFDMTFEMTDYAATSNASVASMDPEASLATLIGEGFDVNGGMTYGAAAYQADGSGPDGPFQMAGTSENGSLGVDIGEDGLAYDISSGPDTFQITGGDIPFPLTFSVEQSAGRFAMPVVPSDQPQTFEALTRMVGLTIDDALWNMFDPSEQVIRDPATIIVDLSGEATLTEDIFDPAYADRATGEAPGTLNSIALNELRVELAGAELTGSGDFEVNNDSMMPQPYGTVDLMLTGGNRLIDTAVNLGFLPQEQAMGARMMLGLFARPGEGEDSLVSTIEVKEDGSVLANGQRIR